MLLASTLYIVASGTGLIVGKTCDMPCAAAAAAGVVSAAAAAAVVVWSLKKRKPLQSRIHKLSGTQLSGYQRIISPDQRTSKYSIEYSILISTV